MAISIASYVQSVSWQQATRKIISGDPLEVLDALDETARQAECYDDVMLQMALASSAMAYMLIDWSRFANWQLWIARFEAVNAAVALRPELALDGGFDVALMRATGEVARALLRGDDSATLAPLGQQLESLVNLHNPVESTQLMLAAAALLPWLQMTKNPAAAQTLHGRMTDVLDQAKLVAPGVHYLHAVWLGSWAQHLHFSGDNARVPEAVEALDDYLRVTPLSLLSFRRARFTAERAMQLKDIDAAEHALRHMLNAIHPRRPMERVIYNTLAAVVAMLQRDPDRALLHATHLLRDLEAAECPPSIATVYRMCASRVYLFRADYDQASTTFAQCVEHAHTAHAAIYMGFSELSRALSLHQHGAADETIASRLRTGLAVVHNIPALNFFYTAPVARGNVCALALRLGIERDFVLTALREFPVSPPSWADEHWPWAMSLRTFGGFRAQGLIEEGRAASKASNRPLSLLKLIAAHGRQGVTVADAADALWPLQDGDQAENSLSVTLLRLRKMHASADLIERRDGWLHLDATQVWTDVGALEAHLDIDAKPLSEAGRLDYINRLFDLYRGACLFGIEDDWAHQRAAHYRGRLTLATQQLLQRALEADQASAAELLMTRAHSRGLDIARLLNALHPGLRVTPAGMQLQRHLSVVGVP